MAHYHASRGAELSPFFLPPVHVAARKDEGPREVCILLASYNGAAFLGAQLESIAAQSHGNWRLIVSDDGSGDETPDIIRRFAATRPAGQVKLTAGPRAGAIANFRSLLRTEGTSGAVLAFADQDDVWTADHLARGLAMLDGHTGPAITGARMRYVDALLQPCGLSPLPRRGLCFQNALVQNVLSGNTMMLNTAAALMLHEAEARAPAFPLHDWWAYQMITGAGGAALYDPLPNLLYRQHGANIVGANKGRRSLLPRLRRYLGGGYTELARQNLAALSASSDLLTEENHARLCDFTEALQARWPGNIRLMRRTGVYYQSRKAQAAFQLLLASGRI